MDSTSAFGMMDLIILGGGLYIFYAIGLLIFKNEINPGLLITRDCDPKKCKDIEAYKKFILPPSVAAGICCLLSGGMGLYQDYVAKFSDVLYYVLFVVFLAGIIWFAVAAKKGQKKFF